MRRVWGHIEGNNLAFLVEILESERLVALVAIKNQQPVATHCPCLCMLDKVLQPGKTKLVRCLAVTTDAYSLVLRVVVLGLVVVLCFKDKEGRDNLALCVNSGN